MTTADFPVEIANPKGASKPPSFSKRAYSQLSSPVATAVVILLAVVWTIPTLGLLITSFRPRLEASTSGWWTVVTDPSFTLNNYEEVLLSGSATSPPLLQYVFNSLIITIPATLIPLAIATMAAYALAWFNFKGRDWLFIGIFALQIVPLQMSLIPLLQLFQGGASIGDVRIFPALNLAGTFWPVWIAHSCFALPLAIFLIHNFMVQLPKDTMEAAQVDGAGPFTTFTKIVLPLSTAAIAAFAIFQFLWVWNDLLVALTFAGGLPRVAPLTVRLAELTGTRSGDWHVLTSGAFISMVIPLIVFFALQRYFVRGLLAGSVKG